MAEQPQTIVQPAAAPNKPLGARNQSNLQSIFKDSPIYAGTLTDEERKIADDNCERSEEQGNMYCDITEDVAQILINYFHIEGVSNE